MVTPKRIPPRTIDAEDSTQDVLEQETAVLISQETVQHQDESSSTHHNQIKLMSHSGQTDSERKHLRLKLRQMNDDILSGAAGLPPSDDDEQDKSAFDSMRDRNNELWGKVRYASEAVLESKNLDLIAAHACKNAESMVTLPRYDADRLVRKLRDKAAVRAPDGSKRFHWKGFSSQAGLCFNSVPKHVSFLYGPLDAEYITKDRKRAERRKREEEDDVKEERLVETDQSHKRKRGTGIELSAVEKHMKETYHAIVERSKQQVGEFNTREGEHAAALKQELNLNHWNVGEREVLIEQKMKDLRREAQKVNLVQTLFNPQSFTQTVENMNHLSFFIKENRAAIEVRSADEATHLGFFGPGPVIKPKMQEEHPPSPKQAIVSLNMRDWRDMCRAFEIERSGVPHRGPLICSLQKLDSSSAQREEATKAATSNKRRGKRSRVKKKGEPSQESYDIDEIDLTDEPQMPSKSNGSARGMLKDEHAIYAKPKVVTPMKHEKSQAASDESDSNNEILNGRRSKSTGSRCTIS